MWIHFSHPERGDGVCVHATSLIPAAWRELSHFIIKQLINL